METLSRRIDIIGLAAILILTASCGEFFRGPNDLVSLTIAPINTTIQSGQTQQFSANGMLGNGQIEDLTQQVTWGSSNSSIATISSTGLATGIARGIVAVSAKFQGKTVITSLSVGTQTAVTPANAILSVVRTRQFIATATDSNGRSAFVFGSGHDSTVSPFAKESDELAQN